MTTELARVEAAPASALVTREYLQEKGALVRSLYAKGTNDLEFEHFIEVCATRGLNPLAKQIYCVMRFDKKEGRNIPTIQTGIDGFRLVAQRTGEYRGQVGPWWCGPDGQWVDVWLDAKTNPLAAKVGVIREGFTAPVFGIVTWSASADERSHFWSKTMGVNQLAKCAESLALRKAFPEELSGLVTSEEMGQANIPTGGNTEPVWAARWRELQALATQAGVTEGELKANLKSLGLSSAKGLDDEAAYTAAVLLVTGEANPDEDAPVEGEVVPDEPAEVISDSQRKRLFAVAREHGVSAERQKEIVLDLTGEDSRAKIPLDKYDAVMATIEAEATHDGQVSGELFKSAAPAHGDFL